MVEREKDFIEKFESEIAPRRQERIDEHKEMTERKARKQTELMEVEERRQRGMAEQRDKEFAEKLKSEER